MQIGRIAPQPGGAAAEIEIHWHGYTRYANAGLVTALLQAQATTTSTTSTTTTATSLTP